MHCLPCVAVLEQYQAVQSTAPERAPATSVADNNGAREHAACCIHARHPSPKAAQNPHRVVSIFQMWWVRTNLMSSGPSEIAEKPLQENRRRIPPRRPAPKDTKSPEFPKFPPKEKKLTQGVQEQQAHCGRAMRDDDSCGETQREEECAAGLCSAPGHPTPQNACVHREGCCQSGRQEHKCDTRGGVQPLLPGAATGSAHLRSGRA